MSEMLRVYGDSKSGNCYKIELACACLDIDYEWREVDILAGETRTPEFLEMNANGKIPLLSLVFAMPCLRPFSASAVLTGSRSWHCKN